MDISSCYPKHFCIVGRNRLYLPLYFYVRYTYAELRGGSALLWGGGAVRIMYPSGHGWSMHARLETYSSIISFELPSFYIYSRQYVCG